MSQKSEAAQRGEQLLSIFYLLDKLEKADNYQQVNILRSVFEDENIWKWPKGSFNNAMAYLAEQGFITINGAKEDTEKLKVPRQEDLWFSDGS